MNVDIDAESILVMITLSCLLFTAVWHDVKANRIPNWLVLVGILLGMLANGLLAPGYGFYHPYMPGGLGWLEALKGLGLGLAVLLPFYWLRAMGAGDVKLMAMVGAFLGTTAVLGALLFSFLAGGVMALLVVIWSKQGSRLLQNIKLVLYGGMARMSAGQLPLVSDMPASVGKLPYAVAIAVGTLGYFAWRRLL